MDYEKLIERLRQYSQSLIAYKLDADFADACEDAVAALSTLQAENERLRAAVNNWKKKYVETSGKWINAENKWAGLDKAVRNGNVYRPMQEELNLTHEENQSLKDANEKLRVELEQAKAEIIRLKHYEDKCHDCPIVCAKTEIIKAHEELEAVQAELERVKRENETLKHALQNWHEED